MQTQAWRQEGGERDGRAAREPVFSFRAINFLVRQLTAHDASWDAYFLGLGREPLKLDLRGARRGATSRSSAGCSSTSASPVPARPAAATRRGSTVAGRRAVGELGRARARRTCEALEDPELAAGLRAG